MAKLSDILELERQREEAASKRVIHLYQEGSFLRAYEWSAWLCCRYVNGFKVTRRRLKDTDDSIVFVGFPLTSLEKYSGADCEVTVNDDKSVDIVLSESLVRDELTDEDYGNWKQSVPYAEQSRKARQDDASRQGQTSPVTVTGVIQRILSFPIERKSPLECMVFMADIKEQIASIM